jgi:hypothetical protein
MRSGTTKSRLHRALDCAGLSGSNTSSNRANTADHEPGAIRI